MPARLRDAEPAPITSSRSIMTHSRREPATTRRRSLWSTGWSTNRCSLTALVLPKTLLPSCNSGGRDLPDWLSRTIVRLDPAAISLSSSLTRHMNIQPSQPGSGGADRASPVRRHPRVAELLARGQPVPAAVDEFLANHQFPLIEPGGATFAWRGAADHVDILRWIRADGDRTRFDRVAGTDLWLLRLPVEDGGRFEYKLAIGRQGGEEWILDPVNPARARDPFGENSVCRAYGYTRPEWSEPRGAPAGRIEAVEVESGVFGERRAEQVYLPACYAAGRSYPFVIIHDGDDFVTYADLSVSLDNLIDAGDISPVVSALIQTRDRMGEYSRGRKHARYLVGELLPALQSRYGISEEPEDRVVMGASLG